MTPTMTNRPELDRFQNLALAVGVAGMAACVAGYYSDTEQFLRSYLIAFLFWGGIALGSLGLLMLHHLVGGAWGMLIRRFLESATRTLPLVAVLLLPLLFNMPRLYKWAQPGFTAGDAVLRHKAAYLNTTGFILRSVFYFAFWIVLAFLLNKWSKEQDQLGPDIPRKKLRQLSGPGLIFFVLTATFAAFDWIMSLDPHWYSTIFGILLISGNALASLAFAIILLRYMAEREPVAGLVKIDHSHDLGKLMFALTMFWAYLDFSQFLIVWSGNLPEEVVWYSVRLTGGWLVVAGIVLVFHFIVPWTLLLFRRLKKNIRVLALLCFWMLAMRLVDLFWTVAPSLLETRFAIHWLDIVAPVAVGGLWLGFFARQLKSRPLQPVDMERLAAYGESHL